VIMTQPPAVLSELPAPAGSTRSYWPILAEPPFENTQPSAFTVSLTMH
jgi:hypothetical protein